jgi:hypothetical protein
MRITDLLAAPADVKALKKEQLGFYILEWMNDEEAASVRQGYGPYRTHQQNFLRGIEESYRDQDVTNAFSSAFRWVLQEDYIADSSRATEVGWYTLTAKGREVKGHEQWQSPRVAHDVAPGPAPNFSPVVADAALAAHLRVLWHEADLTYTGGAYLATEILLGAILEGTLLAKAQANQAAAKGATAAPKGRQLEGWSLANLIEVASELGWIHKTRGQFSAIVRDHRNFVHPLKASTTGADIDKGAAGIAWKVVVETLRDLGIS